MNRYFLSCVFALAAAIASASPAWTWGTYVPADWTASHENFLTGNAPTLSTGRYTAGGKHLSADTLTLPAGDAPVILEVKWDAYLPDIIRDAVSLPSRRASAFSKYAQCRIYG